MGFWDNFVMAAPVNQPDVAAMADVAPVNTVTGLNWFGSGYQIATRDQLMGVPTMARARNIICGTGGSLPIDVWDKKTNSKVEAPRVINQPDSRIPGIVFWAWIWEDMWTRQFGYAHVLKRYADTGRVADMERIAPERVTVVTNAMGTEITGYKIDGYAVPAEDMVVFTGLDEGVLNRAGRTIRAAHALEMSAYNFARNPLPQTIIKNKGVSWAANKAKELKNAFTRATREDGMVIANVDVDIATIGYDPKNLQLNEARQYVALELCRAAGLPAWFASADPTSTTYSNAVNQRRDLVDLSLRNIMTAVEQRLSMSDFVPMGQYCRVSLDDFLRGNPLERAQVYEILNRIGAMTVQQIQEEEDLISND